MPSETYIITECSKDFSIKKTPMGMGMTTAPYTFTGDATINGTIYDFAIDPIILIQVNDVVCNSCSPSYDIEIFKVDGMTNIGGVMDKQFIMYNECRKLKDIGGNGSNMDWYPATMFCLHEDTLVKTSEGVLKIKDIKKGCKVFTLDNKMVDVIYNIKFACTIKFIKIDKNALDNNCPENDLYITPPHPIYINGTEVLAKNLVNGATVTYTTVEKPVHVYSLCTKERYPVLMDGVMVMTWAKEDWEAISKKKNVFESR